MTRLMLDAEVPGGYREAEPAPPGVRVSSRTPLRGVRVESFDCDDEPRSVYLLDLPSREAGYLAERVDKVMEEAEGKLDAWQAFDVALKALLSCRFPSLVVEILCTVASDVIFRMSHTDGQEFSRYHSELVDALVGELKDGRSPSVELVARLTLCKTVLCLPVDHRQYSWRRAVNSDTDFILRQGAKTLWPCGVPTGTDEWAVGKMVAVLVRLMFV